MPTDHPRAEARFTNARGFWGRAVLLAIVAAVGLGWGVPTEPGFVDEWAYLAQTFYGPLWWEGAWNDPAWLDYAAFDLPPLPKYAIAGSLLLQGRPLPGREAAPRWYGNISATFGDQSTLTAARWPSVAFGALGCVALYAIGVIVGGVRVGFVAALLLLVNPLYALHARRAMADVPTEALMLATLALGLWAWKGLLNGRGFVRSGMGLAIGSGILGGLAVLAKLNGGLALMTLGAWSLLAWVVPKVSIGRKGVILGATIVAGCVGYLTFVVGNPFLIAQPNAPPPPRSRTIDEESWKRLAEMNLADRTRFVLHHRVEVSQVAQENPILRHDALATPREKIQTVAVQGFGRFSPLGPRGDDSTRRFDWSQDWGALIWGPLVLGGFAWLFRKGRHERKDGEPPVSWAVAVWFLLALVTVTAFIPMAWNRYMLSIQPAAALLVAGGIVAGFERLAGLFWPDVSEKDFGKQ